MFGAARYANLHRLGGEHFHSVAHAVSPQTSVRGNDQFVVAPGLYLPDGYGLFERAPQRDKLVEDAQVDEEQHAGRGKIVLHGKEALGGVVGLDVVHAGAGYELPVLFAVGGKADASVEEDFEVGPNLGEVVPTGFRQDVFDEYQKPRGYPREVGNVALPDGTVGNRFELGVPLAHESNLLGGDSDEVDQRVDVLYEDSRQVTAVGLAERILSPAATQYESFAIEEAAFGILAQVEGHTVGSALVVAVAQGLGTHGYEFALVVGCSRRFGEMAYGGRPQDILLALHGAFDVGFQLFVSADGHTFDEILVGGYFVEMIGFPQLGISGFAEQPDERFLLYDVAIVGIAIYLREPFCK